jgi:hypothetical protein
VDSSEFGVELYYMNYQLTNFLVSIPLSIDISTMFVTNNTYDDSSGIVTRLPNPDEIMKLKILMIYVD